MRSSDPDKAGADTRNPTMIGERCITCWNLLAVGPNSATAANPAANPTVAANRLPLGVPFELSHGLIPFSAILGILVVQSNPANVAIHAVTAMYTK
jgi:hypothetical protein